LLFNRLIYLNMKRTFHFFPVSLEEGPLGKL